MSRIVSPCSIHTFFSALTLTLGLIHERYDQTDVSEGVHYLSLTGYPSVFSALDQEQHDSLCLRTKSGRIDCPFSFN